MMNLSIKTHISIWGLSCIGFLVFCSIICNGQVRYKVNPRIIYREIASGDSLVNAPPLDEPDTSAVHWSLDISQLSPDPFVDSLWKTVREGAEKMHQAPVGSSITLVRCKMRDMIFSTQALYNSQKVNTIFYDSLSFYRQFHDMNRADLQYLVLFALAHELGHFVNGDVRTNIHSTESEKKADLFACTLLCSLDMAADPDIEKAINAVDGANPSTTHPIKGDRLRAIKDFFRYGNCVGIAAVSVVTVNGQVWTINNLDRKVYRDGSPIRQAKTNEEWKKCETDKEGCWCYPNNDSLHLSKFGLIYNWYAIADPRGLAPYGWHVPSKVEWDHTNSFLKNKTPQERQRFYNISWGYREQFGSFIGSPNSFGDWWSTTEYPVESAWYNDWAYNHDSGSLSFGVKNSGFPIRLLRDVP